MMPQRLALPICLAGSARRRMGGCWQGLLCVIMLGGLALGVTPTLAASDAPAVTATTVSANKPANPTPRPTRANPGDASQLPMRELLLANGGQVFYAGQAGGLAAWLHVGALADQPFAVTMFFVTPDRQALLFGAIKDAKGQDLTEPLLTKLYQESSAARQALNAAKERLSAGSNQAVLQKLAPARPLQAATRSRSAQLWEELSSSTPLTLGNPQAPTLFMLAQPNCAACLALARQLRPQLAAIQLRLLLTAAPATPAEQQASQLVADATGAAWWRWVDGNQTLKDLPATPAELAPVRQAQSLADRWQLNQTPVLVYKSSNDQVKLVLGLPQNLTTILAELGSAPNP